MRMHPLHAFCGNLAASTRLVSNEYRCVRSLHDASLQIWTSTVAFRIWHGRVAS